MALRSEKATAAFGLALLLSTACFAEPLTVPVRHRHLRKGGVGQLELTDSSISFRENGKHQDHAREWKYGDIQQLWLSPESLRILTYEDVGWKLGQDREYEFDSFPKEVLLRVYTMLHSRMDQRFIAALADPAVQPLWTVNAKHITRFGGSEGTVLVGENAIVYKTDEPGESRTWRIRDIENVSSAGPFDLALTCFERDGASYASHRIFRFQLKEPLPEKEYGELWRHLNDPRLPQAFTTTLKENYPK